MYGRVAILLSGSGTTMQNLLDRGIPVVHVVSSRADAFGLTRAIEAGVPTTVVERTACGSLEEFGKRIFAPCRSAGAELICMGGFLNLVPIPADFAGKVLNIHPALIPAFCGKGFHGMRVHEAVVAAGVKITGCTVHFADNEYDHGPVVLQKAVPVMDDDTPETLAARVFAQECEAYPEAIRLFFERKLKLEGRRVRILS